MESSNEELPLELLQIIFQFLQNSHVKKLISTNQYFYYSKAKFTLPQKISAGQKIDLRMVTKIHVGKNQHFDATNAVNLKKIHYTDKKTTTWAPCASVVLTYKTQTHHLLVPDYVKCLKIEGHTPHEVEVPETLETLKIKNIYNVVWMPENLLKLHSWSVYSTFLEKCTKLQDLRITVYSSIDFSVFKQLTKLQVYNHKDVDVITVPAGVKTMFYETNSQSELRFGDANNLTYLDITGDHYTELSGNFSKLQSLKTLLIWDEVSLARFPALETLWLIDSRKGVANFRSCTNLTWLCANKAIEAPPSLKYLQCDFLGCPDTGNLNLPNLHTLKVRIAPESILTLPKLTCLKLKGTYFPEKGLKFLTNLTSLTLKITQVNLWVTRLTNLQHLQFDAAGRKYLDFSCLRKLETLKVKTSHTFSCSWYKSLKHLYIQNFSGKLRLGSHIETCTVKNGDGIIYGNNVTEIILENFSGTVKKIN